MSPWQFAAAVLFLALLPCAAVVMRARLFDRLVALEFGGTVVALLLLLLSRGEKRGSFEDLAFSMALLSYGGSLVFARFLERWL